MPILVSLQKLVQIEHTKHLWPERLQAFSETLSKDPTDRTCWGAVEDWMDEVANEPSMIRAARMLVKRRDINISAPSKPYQSWCINQLPQLAGYSVYSWSIMGCLGKIADEIDQSLAELEKETEPPVQDAYVPEVVTLPEREPDGTPGRPDSTDAPEGF